MTSPWLAAPFFLAVTLVAGLAGAQLLRWCKLTGPGTPGQALFGLAIGYLAISYCLAGLGLAGLLTRPVVAGLLVLVAVLGLGARRELAAQVRRFAGHVTAALAGDAWWMPRVGAGAVTGLLLAMVLMGVLAGRVGPMVLGGLSLLTLAGLAMRRPSTGASWFLVAWCLVTFLAALAPPTDSDWDGLAEHLAQAKVYARTGRFAPLWYDHHSHFPALTQMLFTLGMLFQGPALAKLFHWSFGLLGLAACYTLGRQFLAAASGKWAALTFASTPIIGWLMQVGYVDLSTAAYGLLAVLAFFDWRRRQTQGSLALSAFMAGGAMATKMQGIPLFGVLLMATCLRLLWRGKTPVTVARTGILFALIGAGVASPWYIKTWILTGNPVYPFAYNVFGGKYWGEAEARAYEYHQKEFGMDHLPPAEEYWKLTPWQRRLIGPRSPLNLLWAPWNLTANPVPFTVQWRQGSRARVPVLLTSWIGPMYLLGSAVLLVIWALGRLGAAVVAVSGKASEAAVVLWLFAPLWVWWLMSMQLERYLVPSLVILAPAVGHAWACLERTLVRVLPVIWMAAALGMVAYIASPALLAVSGILSQDTYLRLTSPVYEVSVAVNRVVPERGKVILFGEPRGFYLDREYLWGDPGHHRLIPYDQLKTPQALVAHFRKMGITHVLVNQGQTGVLGPQLGPPLSLLHGALEQGLARVVPDERLSGRGYLLLDISSPGGPAAAG